MIPEGKDPRRVDEKLHREVSSSTCRNLPELGERLRASANVQYLRHRRFFVLACDARNAQILSPRLRRAAKERAFAIAGESPIKFASYAISYRGGHAHVRIEQRDV